jgi:hypothetical protein
MLPVFSNILMMYMCLCAVVCRYVVIYNHLDHHTFLCILGFGILTQKGSPQKNNHMGHKGDLSDLSINVGDPSLVVTYHSMYHHTYLCYHGCTSRLPVYLLATHGCLQSYVWLPQ